MHRILKISLIAVLLFIITYLGYIYYEDRNQDYELKQKVGQMLIIGFRGTEIDRTSYISKAINILNIGGVILFDKDNPSGEFPRNIVDYNQTKKLIEDLNRYSPTPLFVSIDAEGGYINRLKTKYGFTNIPSAEELGKGTTEETKNQANILGQQLKALGFNMDFAPDVDVNVNPENPVIGYLERSFSADPIKVYEHASSFITGLHQNNIITAIKHFPGHGSSTSDSHLGIVDVTNTYQQDELIPYQKLIENGYSDMVMTAHIVNTNVDPNYPATLSPLFIKNILRDQLKFTGIVVSDDMQMGAIVDNYGYDEAIIKAINAGCDILIISNNGKTYDEKAPYDAVDIILKAVKDGKISIEQINDSYNRIQALKEKYGIKK
ncbi:MAG TPA: glycoside hydrolase family 3 protein [Candidatus Pacearchaeota archaeon]|nr:glycoside hydrolase family 3 protein [Candidatus Pacearchaeota archaeon]HPR79990.1 glycoside hydrolase family 3 protein [Candidatus Pacearchaeota archaeon]